jgi:Holliday junction resolvase
VANPNGRKGALFETSVMKWLRERGVSAERLTKAGSKDEGDIVCVVANKTYIFELKNRKAITLPAFWDEAITEARNYASARGLKQTPPAYVIIKRRNAGIEKSWVVQDLEQWLGTRE